MSEKSLTTFYNFLLLVCAMLERNEENSHRKKIEKKKGKEENTKVRATLSCLRKSRLIIKFFKSNKKN